MILLTEVHAVYQEINRHTFWICIYIIQRKKILKKYYSFWISIVKWFALSVLMILTIFIDASYFYYRCEYSLYRGGYLSSTKNPT